MRKFVAVMLLFGLAFVAAETIDFNGEISMLGLSPEACWEAESLTDSEAVFVAAEGCKFFQPDSEFFQSDSEYSAPEITFQVVAEGREHPSNLLSSAFLEAGAGEELKVTIEGEGLLDYFSEEIPSFFGPWIQGNPSVKLSVEGAELDCNKQGLLEDYSDRSRGVLSKVSKAWLRTSSDVKLTQSRVDGKNYVFIESEEGSLVGLSFLWVSEKDYPEEDYSEKEAYQLFKSAKFYYEGSKLEDEELLDELLSDNGFDLNAEVDLGGILPLKVIGKKAEYSLFPECSFEVGEPDVDDGVVELETSSGFVDEIVLRATLEPIRADVAELYGVGGTIDLNATDLAELKEASTEKATWSFDASKKLSPGEYSFEVFFKDSKDEVLAQLKSGEELLSITEGASSAVQFCVKGGSASLGSFSILDLDASEGSALAFKAIYDPYDPVDGESLSAEVKRNDEAELGKEFVLKDEDSGVVFAKGRLDENLCNGGECVCAEDGEFVATLVFTGEVDGEQGDGEQAAAAQKENEKAFERGVQGASCVLKEDGNLALTGVGVPVEYEAVLDDGTLLESGEFVPHSKKSKSLFIDLTEPAVYGRELGERSASFMLREISDIDYDVETEFDYQSDYVPSVPEEAEPGFGGVSGQQKASFAGDEGAVVEVECVVPEREERRVEISENVKYVTCSGAGVIGYVDKPLLGSTVNVEHCSINEFVEQWDCTYSRVDDLYGGSPRFEDEPTVPALKFDFYLDGGEKIRDKHLNVDKHDEGYTYVLALTEDFKSVVIEPRVDYGLPESDPESLKRVLEEDFYGLEKVVQVRNGFVELMNEKAGFDYYDGETEQQVRQGLRVFYPLAENFLNEYPEAGYFYYNPEEFAKGYTGTRPDPEADAEKVFPELFFSKNSFLYYPNPGIPIHTRTKTESGASTYSKVGEYPIYGVELLGFENMLPDEASLTFKPFKNTDYTGAMGSVKTVCSYKE